MLFQALDIFKNDQWGEDTMTEQILYVGDRPEDEQAAKAAGVDFMWADEWRRTTAVP